jgi:1-acyl-sn-glycerol-3-phosphate acyltransferase
MIYWIGFVLVKILDKIYFTTRYIGRENLPAKGSFILACNHLSNVDPFIVGTSVWRHFNFIAKDSLFKNKILGFFFAEFGAVPIKRDSSDFHAIREVLRRMKKGDPLVLFPEGTRGVTGREKKIQPGIGMIALKSDVPVIPTFIQDSDKALPNGKKWFKRYPVKVTFGKPMRFSQDEAYTEVASKIMQSVNELAANQQV